MNYKDTMRRLGALRERVAGADDTALLSEDKAFINALHISEFGREIQECNCKNRYTDAIFLIYKHLKTRGNMAKERRYELRAGVLIRYKGEYYSRHNLTDKVAEAYLALNPSERDRFEKLPETELKLNPTKEE